MIKNRARDVGHVALAALLVVAGISSLPAAQCETTERIRLAASDGVGDNRFGTYLDVDGDVMIVGAFLDSLQGTSEGSAYVFRKDGDDWLEEQKLTAPDGFDFDYFGSAVGVSGDVVVVAARGDDQVTGGSWLGTDGAVYVFRDQGGFWTFEQKIVSNDLTQDDKFGAAVAIDGDAILVGATGDDDLGGYSGSAYVFRYGGGTWTQEAKLLASDGALEDSFGFRVDLRGDRAVVGAPKVHSGLGKNGAAYVFERGGPGWSETQILEANDFAPLDWFGYDVSTDGTVILVGAPSFQNRTYGAYVYRHDGASFVFEQKLDNPAGNYSDFGLAVAIDGHRAVVGAMGERHGGAYRGGVSYVYGFDGTSWGHVRRFFASDPQHQDHFGASVAIDGDLVLVGNEPGIYPGRIGRAYVFDAHELAAYADPKSANAGDTLTLTACGGMPGALVLIAVVAVDGVPTLLPLAAGTFGAEETFSTSATVPGILSGSVVECQAVGFSILGNLLLTNRERIEVL